MPFEFIRKLLRPDEPEAAKIGRMGERAAQKHLKKLGMKILARNFKSGKNEIDIVALDQNCLVFVEVKTRSDDALVNGYFAAMQKSKRNAVKSCAKAYIAAMRRKPDHTRYDAIEVQHDKNGKITSVSHFQNLKL